MNSNFQSIPYSYRALDVRPRLLATDHHWSARPLLSPYIPAVCLRSVDLHVSAFEVAPDDLFPFFTHHILDGPEGLALLTALGDLREPAQMVSDEVTEQREPWNGCVRMGVY